MKKSDVLKLRKGQRVWYKGYEWKFYSASPVVRGIGREADNKLKSGKCDFYELSLKAIDGIEYPIVGDLQPRSMYLSKQYWLGIHANHKDVELKEEI